MSSIWIFGYGSLVHRPGFVHARRVEGYIPGFKRVWHQGSTDHRGTPAAPGRVVTLQPCPGSVTWGVAYELPGDVQQQLETLRYLEWREKQYDVRHLVDVYGFDDQPFVCLPPASTYAQPSQSTPDMQGLHQADNTTGGAMVSAISCPSSLDSQGATGTAAQQSAGSSADPLMSSEEVMQYAPPANWQQLRAEDYLQAPQGRAPPGQEVRVSGTRLLLRNVLCYVASSDLTRNANYLGPADMEDIAQQIAHAVGPSGPNWEYVQRLADAMRKMGVQDDELFALEARVLEIRQAVSQEQQQAAVQPASKTVSA